MGVFTQNGEWEFIGFPNQRHIVYYSCCLEPFSDITFYLIIRRKPLYYVFNLILPCIFITAVTLLVFYLPAESGEKVMMHFKCVNITVVNHGTPPGHFEVYLVVKIIGSLSYSKYHWLLYSIHHSYHKLSAKQRQAFYRAKNVYLSIRFS